jgi:hypothetical protein
MGSYAIDLESGQARRLAPGLKFNVPHFPLVPAMAISRDGRSVLIDVTEGDLHRITALPLDGTGPAETLLTLTVPPTAMAVGPDDSLYLDQLNIAADVMRLAVKGDRPPERIAHTTGASPGMGPLELPDGRLLFSSVASGRTRLLIARAGEAATMFVQANEETSGPATQLGPERVAFFVGTPPAVDIAVALTDGRIVQRLTVRLPQVPSSLAASRDGRTLYYADTGSIWALPVAGGVPQKLYRGDGVATVPDGSALIVQTLDGDTSHFVRVPLAGGERKEIALHGELGPAPTAIGGDTVRSDGRIALPLQIGGSWFWRPGLLDLHTGEVSVVPARVNGDVMKMNWGRDGTLLALAWEYRTEIWRFRPAATPQSASGTRR